MDDNSYFRLVQRFYNAQKKSIRTGRNLILQNEEQNGRYSQEDTYFSHSTDVSYFLPGT